MDSEVLKKLANDPDGLITYEYLANNIDSCDKDIDAIVDNMIQVDVTGQFLASAARYLNAIDPEKYQSSIKRLIASTIDKDREHRYIGDLIQCIWGEDYEDHAEELSAGDNNFRRIYKRLHSKNII
jgi:hypothetical protein